MKKEQEIQNKLNRCLRKTVVFEYKGQRYTAHLNITNQHMTGLTLYPDHEKGIRIASNLESSLFYEIEKYLKTEGFFEL